MFKWFRKKDKTKYVDLIDYDDQRTRTPVREIRPDCWVANRYPRTLLEDSWYILKEDGTVEGGYSYVERWEPVGGFTFMRGPW